MKVLISLKEEVVIAFDKDLEKLFPMFTPIFIHGGTKFIVISEDCESIDSGMIATICNRFYPSVNCLVPSDVISRMDVRECETVGIEALNKRDICSHSMKDNKKNQTKCKSCFYKTWTKKAMDEKIEIDNKILGRPQWVK